MHEVLVVVHILILYIYWVVIDFFFKDGFFTLCLCNKLLSFLFMIIQGLMFSYNFGIFAVLWMECSVCGSFNLAGKSANFVFGN